MSARPPEPLRLLVVVVSYNVAPFLYQTLKSALAALAQVEGHSKLVVVDNASSDDSVEVARSLARVEVLETGQNLGFSKANNWAIRQFPAQYVLLLNPDTLVAESTFRTCVDYLDQHPEVGGLGLRMVDGHGQFLPESKRGLPTPFVAFSKISGLSRLFPKSPRWARYHLGHLSEWQPQQVDVLSGAYMFMRGEALDKAGLLDEDFFMYGEDIDLSWRIVLAGYQNQYLPETLLHYKGESTKKGSFNYVRIFYQAMLIFYRKHFSLRYQALTETLITGAVWARATLALVRRVWEQLRHPLLELLLIYPGLFFLKSYWETNHKRVPIPYPPDFVYLILPAYILVWLLSVRALGGYTRFAKAGTVVQGVLVGTLIISGVTNFFDNYRFSKAIILLGAIWTLVVVLLLRLLRHWLRYRNLVLGQPRYRRMMLIGQAEEKAELNHLLAQSGTEGLLISHYEGIPSQQDLFRWQNQLNISDLVVSARSTSSAETLQILQQLPGLDMEFRIWHPEVSLVLGSSNKNTKGEVWRPSTSPWALRDEQVATRRRQDRLLAAVLLVLSPLLLGLAGMALPSRAWKVLLGKKTWVGVVPGHSVLLVGEVPGLPEPERAALREAWLNHWSPAEDRRIIAQQFRRLGR